MTFTYSRVGLWFLAGLAISLPAAAESTQAAQADNPNAIRVLLSAEVETTLAAQMVGRIAELYAQLGKRIEKGEPVMSFDCSEVTARMNMAQAEYVWANEMLSAKIRLRELDAAGDMEVRLEAANTDKAKAAIAMSQAQVDQCTVLAPFTGHVVRTYVKPHQSVSIGAPLVEMIGEGPLKLRLNVPSRWLRQLKIGTPFEVTVNETGLSYPFKVSLINARVDAVSQTIELEARLDNPAPELLAGMSGIARFEIEP